MPTLKAVANLDGCLRSSGTVWSNVFNGSNKTVVTTTNGWMTVGTDYETNFRCYQSFVRYPIVGIPESSNITYVTESLTRLSNSGSVTVHSYIGYFDSISTSLWGRDIFPTSSGSTTTSGLSVMDINVSGNYVIPTTEPSCRTLMSSNHVNKTGNYPNWVRIYSVSTGSAPYLTITYVLPALNYTVNYYKDSVGGVLLGTHSGTAESGTSFTNLINNAGGENKYKPTGYNTGTFTSGTLTVDHTTINVVYTPATYLVSIVWRLGELGQHGVIESINNINYAYGTDVAFILAQNGGVNKHLNSDLDTPYTPSGFVNGNMTIYIDYPINNRSMLNMF